MRKTLATIPGFLLWVGIVWSQDTGPAALMVGSGTLKINGNLQTTYTYNLDPTSANQFCLKRARFLFSGDVLKDRLGYFVQTEGVGSPFVLDVKLLFKNYIPRTTLCVGRFLPPFTLYMPLSSTKLNLVNYPILTQKYADGVGYLGTNRTTRGVWRQTGLQTMTTIGKIAEVTLGLFNGGKNNNGDVDKFKTFLGRLDVKPLEMIKSGGYFYMGMDTLSINTTLGTHTIADIQPVSYMRYGVFADFSRKDQFYFQTELTMGSDEGLAVKADTTGAEVLASSSMGWFFHAGYVVLPMLETHVRYDRWYPRTDTDADDISALTIGLNFPLQGVKTVLYINYVMNMEHSSVKKNNDQIIAQAQMSF